MSIRSDQFKNTAFVHPSVQIYGHVKFGEGSSLWPYVVIRAEVHEVTIGVKTNIQDFVMIHIGGMSGTVVGDYCSITHHCTLHGCTIGNNCLIGINSTIMDGCVIGDNCVIAGHTFLKEGTVIPDNSIVAGIPGKVIKTKNNHDANFFNAMMYYENALGYSDGDYRRLSDPVVIERLQKLTSQSLPKPIS